MGNNVNCLSTEKEIFDLKVGENQSTSKHYQNNNL